MSISHSEKESVAEVNLDQRPKDKVFSSPDLSEQSLEKRRTATERRNSEKMRKKSRSISKEVRSARLKKLTEKIEEEKHQEKKSKIERRDSDDVFLNELDKEFYKEFDAKFDEMFYKNPENKANIDETKTKFIPHLLSKPPQVAEVIPGKRVISTNSNSPRIKTSQNKYKPVANSHQPTPTRRFIKTQQTARTNDLPIYEFDVQWFHNKHSFRYNYALYSFSYSDRKHKEIEISRNILMGKRGNVNY